MKNLANSCLLRLNLTLRSAQFCWTILSLLNKRSTDWILKHIQFQNYYKKPKKWSPKISKIQNITDFQFLLDIQLQIDTLHYILKTNIPIPMKIVFRKRISKFANSSKYYFWIFMILENWYFFILFKQISKSAKACLNCAFLRIKMSLRY